MKKLVVLVASGLLVQVASAQQFQGLGAADPSQQLKTANMSTFQSQASTLRREERKEPLVTGTSDPSDGQAPLRRTGDAGSDPGNGPGSIPASTTAAAQATGASPIAAAANTLPPPPAPVAPAPTPQAVTPAGPRPLPVLERTAVPPGNQWNPASPASQAIAAESSAGSTVSQSQRMTHIQELVDQIKRRREAGR